MRAIKRFILRIAAGLFQRFVVSSRITTRVLFGFWFRPIAGDDHYFDVTTLVLGRKALENMGPDSHVVDLGTGAVAILGHRFWKSSGCEVISCDIDPEIVALAKANVAYTKAPIRVLQSDFFDAIDEPFDIVTFNPPYISTASGESRGLPEQRRSQWDGGSNGTAVAASFLQHVAALSHPTVAYLGINRLHVPQQLIRPLIEAHDELTLREAYRSAILPVDVYVVDHQPVGGGA